MAHHAKDEISAVHHSKKVGQTGLKYMDLSTLRFRRCRGDMIETCKLQTHKYDNRNGLPSLQFSSSDPTRGNDMKLVKSRITYDIRKHFFTHRIVNLRNSLPAQVVHASSVNDFKNKLGAHWSDQEMVHNYQVEISGTRSRSIHCISCISCIRIDLCHLDGAYRLMPEP